MKFVFEPNYKFSKHERLIEIYNYRTLEEKQHFGEPYSVYEDQYFSKEDILEFADEVIERLEKLTGHKYGISDLFTYNTFTISMCLYDIEEGAEEDISIRVDKKKAKNLKRLVQNYADFVAERFARLFDIDYREY